uniref:Ranaspumin-6 n=1 Tax=Engystomops pustulosus TaxID=76066 RepID=B5DCK6_ENGPU|nr:ranaspumin-6 [Engystomops pustulosus]
MILILGVLLLGAEASAETLCIPGRMKQLDAGAGRVVAVKSNGDVYQLLENNWVQIPGKLIHVTVGPAGLWGVNKDKNIYKYVDNDWLQVDGLLNQIDAGGNRFVVGVNDNEDIFCLNQDQTTSNAVKLDYKGVDGKLKYYSSGGYGSWGVNAAYDIFYRRNVHPMSCQGTNWENVEGKLVMLEVAEDGSVYGVNYNGHVYKREGITAGNPMGTSWTYLKVDEKVRHVSYDRGVLYVVTIDDRIFRC